MSDSLIDYPVVATNNLWTDTGTGSFTENKVYVVQPTRRSSSAAY